MSTRYVWGKYSISNDLYTGVERADYGIGNMRVAVGSKIYSNLSVDPETGEFSPGGNSIELNYSTPYGFTVDASIYPYLLAQRGPNGMEALGVYDDTDTHFFWTGSDHETGFKVLSARKNEFGEWETQDNLRFWKAVKGDTKGTLLGYVSSSVDGQYPQDGVSGNSCVSKRLTHYPPPKNPPIPVSLAWHLHAFQPHNHHTR